MHCTKQPYFHFRSKIWRHRRVSRLRFPLRRENFGNSAINKGYIAYFYCACAKRPHSTSELKSDITIVFLDPNFLKTRKFRHLRTFKADIGLLNICMSFQDLLAWMGVLRAKYGKGLCNINPLTNLIPFEGFLRLCQLGWKSIKKCDRESAHRRTHCQTDWQTQSSFIFCPMLYAISMWQIKTAYVFVHVFLWSWFLLTCCKESCVQCAKCRRLIRECWWHRLNLQQLCGLLDAVRYDETFTDSGSHQTGWHRPLTMSARMPRP